MGKRSLGFFIFAIFLLSFVQTQAEYRVFLLKITKTPSPPPAEATPVAANSEVALPPSVDKIFESNLDPEQYPLYFPLEKDETISYIDTWRCYGRTGSGLPYCPNPKAQRAPSSETNIQNPAPQAPTTP